MRIATIIIGTLLFSTDPVLAQTFREKISREIGFEKRTADNVIIVDNINGNVQVIGYDGDNVVLDVDKTIQTKTEDRLQKGKEQIQLGVIDRADTLIFYVKGTCATFTKNNGYGQENGSRWGYKWNQSNDCRDMFDYKMNFVLKVPFNVHVLLSTVNDGDIVVENMKGEVGAFNVNGHIKLSNLVKKATARTVNGDVDINYDRNPDSDCRFYTLNGNINANFQKDLGANLSFESFNGSFFTNADIESLPPLVEKNNTKMGVKYKLNGNRYKVGNGGEAHLDFETFNGNVYLKQKSN